MDKKLQKQYPVDYNLLIAQDLWRVHYQILLIVLLKKLIKLSANTKTMIKNMKLAELNTKIVNAFLSKNYRKKVDENLKKRFLIYTNFLTMISISLLCCCKKVFIDMKAWIIGKCSIKHYCLNN